MTVFIIVMGFEYEGGAVDRVFSTYDKANDYIVQAYNDDPEAFRYFTPDIVEREVDEP